MALQAIFGGGVPAAAGIPTFLPYNVGTIIDAVAAVWALDTSDTSVIMFGLIADLYTLQGVADARLTNVIPIAGHDADLVWTMDTVIGTLTCTGANMTSANIRGIPISNEGNFFRKVIASRTNARRWILDLVGTNQVKPLNADNVSSYYQQFGLNRINGNTILTIIHPLSTMMPKIVDTAVIRVMMSNSDWVNYHRTMTSTPALCQRAFDFLGTSIPGLIDARTRVAVTTALAAPWDKTIADHIPRKAVALTHAVLTSLRQCPRDWYQGNKAKVAIAASTYATWVAMTDSLQNIIANVGNIRAAADLAALIAEIPGTALNC